jgi:hypothetical protein
LFAPEPPPCTRNAAASVCTASNDSFDRRDGSADLVPGATLIWYWARPPKHLPVMVIVSLLYGLDRGHQPDLIG